MFNGRFCKIFLWLKITVLTSTVGVAQTAHRVGHFVDHPSKSNPYYIIRAENYDSRFRFQRRIDQHHIVIEAADTINSSAIVGPANDLWKLPASNYDNFDFPAEYLINIKDGEFEKIAEAELIRSFGQMHLIRIKTKSQFEIILHDPDVTFIKKYIVPHEESPNTVQDLSVNKINAVHDRHPELNGDGLVIAIKERQIDTTDIDLKNRVVLSELADDEISLHANQIATIVAGAGNTIPSSKGIAWRSNLISASYDNLLPDDPTILSKYNVSVENHSYGTDIENFYGPEAQAYDEAVSANNSLLHVFSAGNSGEETSTDGPYANVGAWANLTGNMKMSKNTIIVGGHYQDMTVDSRNSRGPAYDGRVKPEIVAFGPEGTSDAAAFVSGTAALLQQKYLQMKTTLPTVDLLKSLLIVTADEIGVPGIDFTTGYGALNARKAVMALENNWFFRDSVKSNTSKSFDVILPGKVDQLKVAVNWIDRSATAGSSSALVNDLDLVVTHSASDDQWLPWVLNSYPQVDSLQLPAIRKEDHLNNIELITIDDADAGVYRLTVSSGNLQGNNQSFAIAYWIDDLESFVFTYPDSLSSLEAARDVFVRWDNTFQGEGILTIEVDDHPELNKSEDVDLSKGVESLAIPETAGRATLKMLVNSNIVDSTTFIITPRVLLNVEYNCNDAALISWTPIDYADGYTIYNLGHEYMEVAATVSDTLYSINKATFANPYFAVAPRFGDREGLRSSGYNIGQQGVNCYYVNFIAEATPAGAALLTLNTSTLIDLDHITWQKLAGNDFVDIGSTDVGNNRQLTFVDTHLSAGTSQYRAILHTTDRNVTTDTVTVYYADANTVEVFPNPVDLQNDQLLTVLTNADNIQFRLFDSQGRVVKNQLILNTLFKFSVSDLTPGLYYYSIERNSRRLSSGKILLK